MKTYYYNEENKKEVLAVLKTAYEANCYLPARVHD